MLSVSVRLGSPGNCQRIASPRDGVIRKCGHHASFGCSAGLEVTMLLGLATKWIIILTALALTACSASVRPNPSYPGFIGTYGPGGPGWLGINR